jgi:hypothetical protein
MRSYVHVCSDKHMLDSRRKAVHACAWVLRGWTGGLRAGTVLGAVAMLALAALAVVLWRRHGARTAERRKRLQLYTDMLTTTTPGGGVADPERDGTGNTAVAASPLREGGAVGLDVSPGEGRACITAAAMSDEEPQQKRRVPVPSAQQQQQHEPLGAKGIAKYVRAISRARKACWDQIRGGQSGQRCG